MSASTKSPSEWWRMALVLLIGAHNTWTRATGDSWMTAIWAGAGITIAGLWVVYRERNPDVRTNSLDWLLTTQVMIGFA